MDFLAANQRLIEEAVYYRMADLLNTDVGLIFHDTTSPHFETDDEDEPRDRPVTDDRDNAPQLVVGLAVNRDGLPV